MLPKERVIAALEHREGDRVPVGEIGADWEITERALGHQTYYRSKWKEWVAEWEGRRDEVAESYGRDIVEIARKFEWDFVVVPLVPARLAEVRHAVQHAAPGGGLVLTCGNTLLVGTKYDNYMAMLSAWREFGSYPIRV